MDLLKLRKQAQEEAREFLEKETEYRMGYIEAEQPHPLTRKLSQTYAASVEDGVKLLLQVDDEMALRAMQTLTTEAYARFADTVRATIANGGRVIFSGCGSSGRLSMRLEQSWRNAIMKLSAQYPKAESALLEKLESVGNVMTGGDYAVIRAAESFEDSTKLGEEQVRELGLCEKDLLVGVTATGETTSILGTAMQALRDDASVYMLICADHRPLVDRMKRARVVYTHPKCSVMFLPCGPMALTGSTRMQSSSFEQFAGAVALEGALHDILIGAGVANAFNGYGWYGEQFKAMTEQLLCQRSVEVIAKVSLEEQAVYEAGGLMTLFADEFLMDVLTDTTERAPTFMTPPFCSADMVGQEQSWAFVKNPTCNTDAAWVQCFLREPNCLDWSAEKYAQLGLNKQQIEKIPDLSNRALKKFMIGNEPMPQRENCAASHALWIDAAAAPDCFYEHAKRYRSHSQLTIEQTGITLAETGMDMFEHLCIKLLLNTVSTGVMARMGRIDGNWMTCLAMSNKKLIDRSARIVSDVCDIPYEQAMEEIFYSRALNEAQGISRSPAQEAIRRLSVQ